MIEDDDVEEDVEVYDAVRAKRKRLMILLLPILIVIGISATIFFVLQRQHSAKDNYSIVQYNKENADDISVFYDLPEIVTQVKGKEENHELRIKINLELSSIEDLKLIEILAPKLSDVIIGHTIELNSDELAGSVGLYWLKEELFYRLNLAATPVKIKNISFSLFELK